MQIVANWKAAQFLKLVGPVKSTRLQSTVAILSNRHICGRYMARLKSLKAFTGRPPKNVDQLKLYAVGEAGVGIERVLAAKKWVIEADGANVSFLAAKVWRSSNRVGQRNFKVGQGKIEAGVRLKLVEPKKARVSGAVSS